MSFTIGLDPVSDRTVTVKWSTANDAGGTHPAGAADYTAVSPARTATIAAGASSVVVTVQTTQDSLDEPDETFLLELSRTHQRGAGHREGRGHGHHHGQRRGADGVGGGCGGGGRGRRPQDHR